MSDNKDLKIAIQAALTAFEKKPLAEASLGLLGTLGYRSERRLSLKPNAADQFRAEFDAAGRLNADAALVSDWKSVDLLIQITDNEIREAIKGTKDMFASKKLDDKDIRSYLFFAVELKGKQYTRTQLAGITREINKLFPMPVMVIFRYDEVVSLAIIARRINKRDGSKDVLEKVTLIKDIRFTGNRAQIEILHDLAITQLMQDYAISNFVDLQHAWEKTLDLNELNKKFYKEIANWYFWAVKTVKFPRDAEKDEETRNATSVIRLITRLIFVWFIKEKGLVPEELFDERWLKDALKFEDPKKSTYYKAILQNLFFATLNNEMNTPKEPNRRMFRRINTGGLDPDYLMSNYYRYKQYFKNPAKALEIFEGIPFLNGGLFECLDKEEEKDGKRIVTRVDGFSDRDDNPLTVPDDLFLMEKEKEIDLNEVYDTRNKKYKVRGLIHIFNSYKFTIEENTPIEEEIALDPELLGKVFENLLAAYNPETGTTARKQTGSFYTPREIVNYMVDEALLAYLNAEGGVQNAEFEERLRDLLSYNPNPPAFSDAEKSRLIAAIDNVKVLDPAAGSGAFPMGVLHKLVFLLAKLDPKNEGWKQRHIENANEILDPVLREAQIKNVEEIFAENHDDYGRKLFLIENCIYGVDIQPIAVQIAKLRFFISLVVDQKTNAKKPNLGIRPLPNLETKFVAANTLIGIQRPDSKSENEARASASIPPEVEEACEMLIRKLEQYLKSRNPDLRARYVQEAQEFADVINAGMGADFQPLAVDWVFSTAKDTAALKALLPGKREAKASPMVLRNQQIEGKEKELERVRREHFSARTPAKKRMYRDLDKKLRLEIADLLGKNHALEDEAAQQLAGWDPYNQNAHADFFDPEWMFGVEGGFDVVIGNPPYMRVQGLQQTQSEYMDYYRNQFQSAKGSFDLYALFIERGYQLLNKQGQFAYIVPHKFFQANFGEALRSFLAKQHALRQIVRFGSEQVFEEATTYTCLLFLSAIPVSEFDLLEVKTLARGDEVLQAARYHGDHPDYAYTRLPAPVNNSKTSDWNFAIGEQNKVLRRIQQHPRTLEDITRKIFVGLQTSADKIYVLEVQKESKHTVLCYSKQLDEVVEIERGFVKPFLMGKDVHRYAQVVARNVVIFPYKIVNGKAELMSQNHIKNNFPLAWKYLKRNQQDLGDREHGRMHNEEFYAYIYPKNLTEFDTPKIMTPEIALGCQMTLDTEGVFYHTTKVYSFVFKPEIKASTKFMLGLLNSKVLWYFLSNTGYVLRGGYYTFKTDYLKPFPIADSTPEQERGIETLVDYVLYLKALDEPKEIKASSDIRVMTAYFEQLIDILVYEMYFPEELSDSKKLPSRVLTQEQLPSFRDLRGNKTNALRELFEKIYEPRHPVRSLAFFMDTLETVRVIEAKSKTS